MNKNSYRMAWRLIRAYWISDDRWAARSVLALVIALDLLLVYRAARITFWQKDFYDALSTHDIQAFWRLLVELAVIALAGIAMNTTRGYTAQCLEMRWRSWMTDVFLRNWLGDAAYYRIERAGLMDNADQRIADDLKWLAANTLNLGLGLLRNIVNLATFAVIVWGLSGVLTLTLAGSSVDIYGYMLWVGLVYAIAGSYAMERIGSRLVAVDYRQQQAEADFRFLLMRVRTQAEQIAFYAGEATERVRLLHRFAAIRANWRLVMTYTKRITMVESLYTEAAAIIPYLLNGPRYFSGAITLGDLIQFTQSFMRVRVSLSWFIYNYKELALLRSVCSRLLEFEQALAVRGKAGIEVRAHAGRGIRLYSVQPQYPDGRPMTLPLDWEIKPASRWLLRGPSGIGKSTVLRALAGLWAEGTGVIERPAAAKLMFTPQESYLPSGTLRVCLCYPSDEAAFTYDACRKALEQVGLGHLAPDMDKDDNWSQRLSGGELQRLAFGRVLLQQPDYLFLDEATSALDEDSEAWLYALLFRKLPMLTLVSIGHRPGLERYHTDSLTVCAAPGRAESKKP